MCRLPCSASVSLPGSPGKSARAFCRRISTTQSPMSRARKRYAGRYRSDAAANRNWCLRTAQRWLDQIDPCRCSQAHFSCSQSRTTTSIGSAASRRTRVPRPASCNWRPSYERIMDGRRPPHECAARRSVNRQRIEGKSLRTLAPRPARVTVSTCPPRRGRSTIS